MKKFLQKIDNWIVGNVVLDDPLHIILGILFAMTCYIAFALDDYYSLTVTSPHVKAICTFVLTFIFGYVFKEWLIDKKLKQTYVSNRDWIMTQFGGMLVIIYEMITSIF